MREALSGSSGSVPIAVAVLLAAMLALAFAPAASGALPPACDAAASVSTVPVQDDGYSGRDAGDAPTLAVELPGHGQYWGMLDFAAHEGADLADWFALEVPYTRDQANFSVGSNLTGTSYLLEVFLPGEASPALRVTSADLPRSIPLSPPGLWLMRITPTDVTALPSGCEGSGSALVGPTGLSGHNQLVMHDYGLYFGCDPICAWTA